MTKREISERMCARFGEFVERQRLESKITLNALCREAGISKTVYIAFKKGGIPA
ncbi:MAG TPA: hypothetical protein H9977_09960 [Candidatus Parabacteroides intestinipullorum]|uniref:Uncharacterized protein n=1 Tax=Candidatus Parabacteroides intestinipullorum TaxID=2838723 RepID=A0A9D2BGI4_9BACT|nr:hypothetical protein [Candidatus Parabacteroides intestinipullorum]